MQSQIVKKLPVLYISHGGPTTSFRDYSLMDKNIVDNYCDALEDFGKQIRQNKQLKNIIIVSAHHEAKKFSITQGNSPQMIHDHGFNQIFNFVTKSKGNQNLSDKLYDDLKKEGLDVQKDNNWGFDHGVWSVTKLIDPEGIIPVVSISMSQNWNAEEHIKLGQILGKYRNENLVIGSGSVSHNLREMFSQFRSGLESKYAKDFKNFNNKIVEYLENKQGTERNQAVVSLLKEKIYKINHPTNDHFFPIFVAVGAANESKGKCLVYDELGFSTSIVFE
ncbi:Extradiol ring-cleavage dioxygenase, class III enzyme, subunit B [Pseudocohnilembus persalinus]|uniref:Extradiol ring-cleavage dioxygenase, class III enzyme, subunit B n=1 Tax=Pseudocohnilembus persalinus TaxID=266149 RepID=A0A0V0QZZ1_PSEPJ|nr:Extradiol ring-cleavage dioxygenase, class III enzyme, subunit B [Pseudocohnilembus persalinus]|eukprot:KRX07793.1 Extradiol ring-cleavage dioxygenase, class III enzyme, subunit B [Pseudocohnilembus persalinus]